MNDADPDEEPENMQEVTFYALLCLIALTESSPRGQSLAKEAHAIGTLIR
jgi:hypothetical protein